MYRILVTGSNGFVGSSLCNLLQKRGIAFVAAVRKKTTSSQFLVGDLTATTDWKNALIGCDTVIHLASRVHVLKEDTVDSLGAYREINVAATLNLARQAVSMGVQRFVFVSSVKVNGESTASIPFSEADQPFPQDPYAISKYEAEVALRQVGDKTGLEVVIVRAPLVYGPGVGGNFLRLLKLIQKRIPLPLGAVENQRDMIYVGNLADALILCATHAAAAGKIYLVSDGTPVSTPQLLHSLSRLMSRSCHIIPLPVLLLRWVSRMIGKLDEIERLTSSLTVDSTKICRELDWSPPYTMQQGLAETVCRMSNRE